MLFDLFSLITKAYLNTRQILSNSWKQAQDKWSLLAAKSDFPEEVGDAAWGAV